MALSPDSARRGVVGSSHRQVVAVVEDRLSPPVREFAHPRELELAQDTNW